MCSPVYDAPAGFATRPPDSVFTVSQQSHSVRMIDMKRLFDQSPKRNAGTKREIPEGYKEEHEARIQALIEREELRTERERLREAGKRLWLEFTSLGKITPRSRLSNPKGGGRKVDYYPHDSNEGKCLACNKKVKRRQLANEKERNGKPGPICKECNNGSQVIAES